MRKLFAATFCSLMLFSQASFSLNDADLDKLTGYTEIGNFYATSNLEGNVHNQLIQLSNGMIFKFTDFDYIYAYSPEVRVFAHEYSLADVQQVSPNATDGFTAYVLVIDDQLLNAIRVQ